MISSSWTVHKFGGTSLGNAACMRKCIDIVAPITLGQRVAVVVSAMGGTPKITDMLLNVVHSAARGRKSDVIQEIENIRSKHQQCVLDILQESVVNANKIMKSIDSDLRDILDLLKAVELMKMAHPQILELVSGYGEVWSATIMVEAMHLRGLSFVLLNAREVLFVSEQENVGTKVHWEQSQRKLDEFIAATDSTSDLSDNDSKNLLITGFIASTLDGVATTLKRDGSDFSASIFGKLLRSSCITIWTDVSGVYSADPRRVPDAQILNEVSYAEAIELAYFGAKVLHPKTMAPAIEAHIPIYIKNTFDPTHAGTRIFLAPISAHQPGQSQPSSQRERSVCGFTTVDQLVLMNIEGTGMIGVPGIAHRLFGALKAANISVMFIAQASSEHSICFATKSVHRLKAREAIEETFFYELKQGFITNLREIEDCSIIAAVGESMNHMPGVAGIFFSALGGAAINVLSISQGCDERNISAVVYSKDATKALRAVHSAFWLSSLDLNIGIVGTGRVGSALIQILLDQSTLLGERFGLKIKLRGVANSRKMLLGDDISQSLRSKLSFFAPKGPGVASRRASFDCAECEETDGSEDGHHVRKSHSNVSLNDLQVAMSEPNDDNTDTDLSGFVEHLQSGTTPHSIIIDASTSHAVAALHSQWLSRGVHVVTANKRALSSTLDLYNGVFSAARSSKRMYMSEVTIGASLPIRTTLNDMMCSGDAVHSIVGIMSVSAGTVLTHMYDSQMSFTDAVQATFNQGLFEDDVFTDLAGSDAAEKLLILARELGVAMSMEDVIVEPLASRRPVKDWKHLDSSVFAAEDVSMADRVRSAAERGCVLRYIQRIECTPPAELGNHHLVKATATVRLEEVPRDSNHALVHGAVYHFSFHTERYAQNPLIVQGPLSDSANTASGIIGDIFRIARSIGARDRGPEALIRVADH